MFLEGNSFVPESFLERKVMHSSTVQSSILLTWACNVCHARGKVKTVTTVESEQMSKSSCVLVDMDHRLKSPDCRGSIVWLQEGGHAVLA